MDATPEIRLSHPRPGGNAAEGALLASFVIAARHRSGRVAAAAIESVLGQTVPDFELIVVDGDSTDVTPAIVQQKAAGDDRVRLVRVELGNAGAARNVDPQEIAHLLRERCCFTHATVTFRRSAVEDVGGYREPPGSACEDYDLYLRLAERSPGESRGVIGAWRAHEGNLSTSRR